MQLDLLAPLTGPVTSLSETPDPVFAGKVLGDGIAIDPVDPWLLAPCDGRIVQIHPARHALTLRTAEGLDLLIHLGIDTVKLRGEGFHTQLRVNDMVRAGDRLIEIDLDQVAQKVPSLLSPVLVIEPKGAQIQFFHQDFVEAGKDVLYRVIFEKSEQRAVARESGDHWRESSPLRIADLTGLHARPAALVAKTAQEFQAEIKVARGQDEANGKSMVDIMGLAVAGGEIIRFRAQGVDADLALEKLVKTAKELFAEDFEAHQKPVIEDHRLFKGLRISSGQAVGQIVKFEKRAFEYEEWASSANAEKRRLEEALVTAENELTELWKKTKAKVGGSQAEIFMAQKEFLKDPQLLGLTMTLMEQGHSAPAAWDKTLSDQIEKMRSMKNEIIAGRASDLKDVRDRVLQGILGGAQRPAKNFAKTILIARELTASDTAEFDKEKIMGFCTVEGGPTSHVAILAKDLGIPAITGISPEALNIEDGRLAFLDANKEELRLDPSSELMDQIAAEENRLRKERETDLRHAHEEAKTVDGQSIEVFANIGNLAGSKEAVRCGAEGVGLLRSEFIFMERPLAPSEEEQLSVYQAIADSLEGRPLTIRTLDVGGDKPLSYMPLPKEENPFLGVRGIRLSLQHEEIFRTQLRALLRVKTKTPLRVMFPMIAQMDELRRAKAIYEEERAQLGAKGLSIGIMVEVPSAAIEAQSLAKEVDFFSVGTNDLTQYTMAMDRGHPELSKSIKACPIAVLRLIQMTVDAAHAHKKWVGVCGGVASDPEIVPLLLGLGVDELSVSVPAIPKIKACIRTLNLKHCRQKVWDLLGERVKS